jgi:hypothetical protein
VDSQSVLSVTEETSIACRWVWSQDVLTRYVSPKRYADELYTGQEGDFEEEQTSKQAELEAVVVRLRFSPEMKAMTAESRNERVQIFATSHAWGGQAAQGWPPSRFQVNQLNTKTL